MSVNPELLTQFTEGDQNSLILDDEMSLFVSDLFHIGDCDNEHVVEIVCELLSAPDRSAVVGAVEAAYADFLTAKANWPATTDCDRLDAAFAALNDRGIIAIQDAHFDMCGGRDVCESEYAVHPNPTSVEGFCFFHDQDIFNAVEGNGLWVAFGPLPDGSRSKCIQIGRRVRKELKRAGLRVEWNVSANWRIHLPDFVWQKR